MRWYLDMLLPNFLLGSYQFIYLNLNISCLQFEIIKTSGIFIIGILGFGNLKFYFVQKMYQVVKSIIILHYYWPHLVVVTRVEVTGLGSACPSTRLMPLSLNPGPAPAPCPAPVTGPGTPRLLRPRRDLRASLMRERGLPTPASGESSWLWQTVTCSVYLDIICMFGKVADRPVEDSLCPRRPCAAW